MESDESALLRGAIELVREVAVTLRDCHHRDRARHAAAQVMWSKRIKEWRNALRRFHVGICSPTLVEASQAIELARSLHDRAERELTRIELGARQSTVLLMGGLNWSFTEVWRDEETGIWTGRVHVDKRRFDLRELPEDHFLVRAAIDSLAELRGLSACDREGLNLPKKPTEAQLMDAYADALESTAERMNRVLAAASQRRGPRSHYTNAFEVDGTTKPLARRLIRLIAERPGDTAIKMSGELRYKDDKPIRGTLTDLENYGLIASRGRNSGFDLTREGRAELDSLG